MLQGGFFCDVCCRLLHSQPKVSLLYYLLPQTGCSLMLQEKQMSPLVLLVFIFYLLYNRFS